jgi:holo-[acyl-carrier protein] synthase
VRARGARTIVLATDGDDSVTPYADHVIRLPDTKSLLTPLLTLVPLQVCPPRIGPRPRPGRRPAAQPGEVRHGRVDRAVPSSGSASTSCRSTASSARSRDADPRRRACSPTAERRAPPESLAARFAAKEAVAKALGAPGGLRWRDAEVVSDGSGRPRIAVHGGCRRGGAQPGDLHLAPVAVARRRRGDGRRGGRRMTPLTGAGAGA